MLTQPLIMDNIRKELNEIKNRLLDSENRIEVLESLASINVDGGEVPEYEEHEHLQEEFEEIGGMQRVHARVHYLPAVSAVHEYGGIMSEDDIYFDPTADPQQAVMPEPSIDEIHGYFSSDNPMEGSSFAPMPEFGSQQQQGQEYGEGMADLNARALSMGSFTPVMVPIYSPYLSCMNHNLQGLMGPQMFPLREDWYCGIPNYSGMFGIGMQLSGMMPTGMNGFRVLRRHNKHRHVPYHMPCSCYAAAQAEMRDELQQVGDEAADGNEVHGMEAEVVTPNQRFNVEIGPPPPLLQISEVFGSQPKSKKLNVSTVETKQEEEHGQSSQEEVEANGEEIEKVENDPEQTENSEPTVEEQESKIEEPPSMKKEEAKNVTEQME